MEEILRILQTPQNFPRVTKTTSKVRVCCFLHQMSISSISIQQHILKKLFKFNKSQQSNPIQQLKHVSCKRKAKSTTNNKPETLAPKSSTITQKFTQNMQLQIKKKQKNKEEYANKENRPG